MVTSGLSPATSPIFPAVAVGVWAALLEPVLLVGRSLSATVEATTSSPQQPRALLNKCLLHSLANVTFFGFSVFS